jgi:hypothetical protein
MNQFEQLREMAEQILAAKNNSAMLSLKDHSDMNKLLHELGVHQIELEIQNEELRSAKLHSDQIQKHLAQLYHQAPVGYVSLNAQAMIVEANQTFSHLLGTPLEEMQGKSFTQFMPESEKKAFLARYRSFYNQPTKKEIETCLLAENNQIIQVRLDGRISKQTLTSTQEHEVLLISITDVSEITKTQKLLLEAKEEAERANQAKSMFLSQMSHNLRTPLNAIIGFAQILDLYQTVPLDTEQLEYIQHIMEAGQHLLELINDVLNFAKIEAGRIEITHDDVNIHNLLQQLIGLIAPLAAQRNVAIHYQESNDSLTLVADAMRLKEVLLNLLSNAIKYNRKGGYIDLRYHISTGNNCRIYVKDNGIGLSHEQQHLFQPFERLGAETSNIEGTGIGLAICKRLIEAMNGKIGVDSLQGEGSTFWIELPLGHQQTTEFVSTVSTVHNLKVKCNSVLYIEDNAVNLSLMEVFFLGQENITFLQATHPLQGLELAKKHQPDVILLDIQLPDMDGFEVFQRLKADAVTKNIPVIAVSAYAMPQDINKALQVGFYDYVAKPFNFHTLLTTINSAFNLH